MASSTDLALGADGSSYVTHAAGDLLTQTTPDGATQGIATGLSWPSGVNVKPDGTVYFSVTHGHSLRTISPDGRQVNESVPTPLDVTWDPFGNIYVASTLRAQVSSGIYLQHENSGVLPTRLSGPQGSPAPTDGAALGKTYFPTRILRYSENLGGLLAVVEDDNRVWLIKDQAAPGLGYAAGEFTVADPGGREVYTLRPDRGRHPPVRLRRRRPAGPRRRRRRRRDDD